MFTRSWQNVWEISIPLRQTTLIDTRWWLSTFFACFITFGFVAINLTFGARFVAVAPAWGVKADKISVVVYFGCAPGLDVDPPLHAARFHLAVEGEGKDALDAVNCCATWEKIWKTNFQSCSIQIWAYFILKYEVFWLAVFGVFWKSCILAYYTKIRLLDVFLNLNRYT